MVDDFVQVVPLQTVVALERIAVQRGPGFHVFAYQSVQVMLAAMRDHRDRPDLAATFQDSGHNGLPLRSWGLPASTTAGELFVFVHEPRLAADERLINFDFAREQFKRTGAKRVPNPVEQVPCGFLCDAQIAGNLATADAVFAIDDQPRSGKPFVKLESRVLENRPDLDRELLFRVLRLALPQAARGQKPNLFAAARRADDTVRPTARYYVVKAVVAIGEVQDGFLEGVRFVSHNPILPENGS
jgi:hypothetical protein